MHKFLLDIECGTAYATCMITTSLLKLLRLLPAETAHQLAVTALERGLVPAAPLYEDKRLAFSLAGLALSNPVGLAAGFDKNAQTLAHIFTQGFGFAEVGTVTPKPQPGNPKPRVFRFPKQQAVVNRLGFNNAGIDAALVRLQSKRSGIVGVNIGKNKDAPDAVADYITGFRAFHTQADFLTINISSPNTEGLRTLQYGDELEALLGALQTARREADSVTPLFVKIAPDMDQQALQAVIEAAIDTGMNGLIISNTTLSRPEGIPETLAGGLSGPPLFALSTERLRQAYRLSEGKLALIGVGGIASAEDAYQKIRAGASAIQLYTALIYQGFTLVDRIKRGLVARLERDGYHSLSEAVGQDA